MTACAVCDGEIMDGGDRWIHVGEIGAAHEFGMDPTTGGVTMIAARPWTFEEKAQRFAQAVENQQRARMAADYPNIDLSRHGPPESPGYWVKVTHARKYSRVDFNGSGKYMIERATGDIFGIKGYGVIHRGHRFGNLDTIEAWAWGDYRAQKVTV